MQLSIKLKTVFEFFSLHFWSLHQILNILKKKKLQSLKIYKIIDSRKCFYQNIYKVII